MELLIVAALLATGLVVGKKRSAPASSPPQLPPATKPPDGLVPSTDNKLASDNKTAEDVGIVFTAVAAVTAAVVVGAELGDRADTVLAGAGKDPTLATVASVAGGVTSGAIAAGVVAAAVTTLEIGSAGLIAAFTSISAIAWPVAAIALAVGVLVYAIGSIISDVNRLHYGQAGAAADYEKKWWELYGQMFAVIRADPNYTNLSDNEIWFLLTPFVDGFMWFKNMTAYFYYMALGPGWVYGVEVNWDSNLIAQFGYDRGYWYHREGEGFLPRADGVRWVEHNPVINYFKAPASKFEMPEHIALVKELLPKTSTPIYGPLTVKEIVPAKVVKVYDSKYSTKSSGTAIQPAYNIMNEPAIVGYADATGGLERKQFNAGVALANFGSYMQYMMKEGANPHQGIKDRAFAGNINSDDSLTWEGHTYHWRELAKI